MVRNLALDLVDRNAALVRAQDIGEHFADEIEVDRAAAHHRISRDPVERAFELANVGDDALGEEHHHVLRHLDVGECFELLDDDVEPELEVGLVDVGDEAPGQAREDARLDPVEVLRRAVGTDHEAAPGRDDLVHRVEEFFLRRFLARDELDIVDHQQIGGAELLLELDRVIGAKRGDELDHELFGRHVDDLGARAARAELVADRVQEVGLAAAGAAVDKERVEHDVVGAGERPGRVERNLIGLADDEAVEPIARLEARCVKAGLRLDRAIFFERGGDFAGGGGARRFDMRAGADHDIANERQRRTPGEPQPVAEIGLDPVRHELRGKLEAQGAGCGIEATKRDRAQPAVESARAAITAEPRPDHFPCRRNRVGCYAIGRQSYATRR